MPINALASHTIIFEHNEYFWVLNILLGVAIPLICNTIFNKVKFLIKNIEYYW